MNLKEEVWGRVCDSSPRGKRLRIGTLYLITNYVSLENFLKLHDRVDPATDGNRGIRSK